MTPPSPRPIAPFRQGPAPSSACLPVLWSRVLVPGTRADNLCLRGPSLLLLHLIARLLLLLFVVLPV